MPLYRSIRPDAYGNWRNHRVPRWVQYRINRYYRAANSRYDLTAKPAPISDYDEDLAAFFEQCEAMADARGDDYLYDRLPDHLSAILTRSGGKPLYQPLGPAMDQEGRVYGDQELIQAELAGEIPIFGDALVDAYERERAGSEPTPEPERPDYDAEVDLERIRIQTQHPDWDWDVHHMQVRPEGMLNIAEAAAYVGCSTATISNRIRSGDLPFVVTRGTTRWLLQADLDRVRVGARGRPRKFQPVEEVMSDNEHSESTEDLEQRPITNIPIGSDWQSFRGFHPGALVRVDRENNNTVRYRSLRLGGGEGTIARGKRHRLTRQQFLERFRPYRRKDWLAATREIEPSAEPVKESKPPMTWTYAITTEPESEPVMEAVPPSAITPPVEPTKQRRRWTDVTDQKEINDIVDLWRSEIPLGEIATEYRITVPSLYKLIQQAVGQEEYALRSVVDFLKRNAGQQLRPSRISQMTAARDGAFLDKVLSLGEQKGVLKVWNDGRFRLIGLPDSPAPVPPPVEQPTVEPEPPVVVPSAVAESIPVSLDQPTEEPVTVATEPTAAAPVHTQHFRITIRRVVEDHYIVEAENMLKAAQIASEGLQPNEEVWNISANE